MLKEGDPAPNIQLETDTGEPFELTANRGKKIVLYFFPRADTPGCTTESCEFRDSSTAFDRKTAVVLGISPDTPKAQTQFKNKYGLNFTLLCDIDKKAAMDYGVLKEKNMYGKKVMGIERTTFLIGEDGRIEKIFSKVKPAGHAQEVLAALS
ncbi:MAG: thioredoxin-dependent thiol peroxidase [Acidobacteriota bacterium]|nr:thioredoxin-dependent thiol peroxidase [Acidobacteriota bacterium]